MSDGFVNAYSTTTGDKHRIPAHWVDHPVLGKGFRKTPKQNARDAADGPPVNSNTPTPAAIPASDKTPA
jgi:hypothetical protein